MNKKQKIFRFSLAIAFFMVFLLQKDLKGQTVSTYFSFNSDILFPSSLKTDSAGNLYFVNYDQNWNPKISKLSSSGTVSTVISGNYYPQSFDLDSAGNVFFFDAYTWPAEIKKVSPTGVISTFLSGNYYAEQMAFDSSGNLFFSDTYNWPADIKKVTPDGTVSTFVTGNFYPMSVAFDNSGNLYFADGNNWPPNIERVTPDGTMSTFVSGNYYPQNLTFDSSGNMYFLDGYNYPADIKKVSSDGTVSLYVNSGLENPNSLVLDKAGNLYFIDQLSGGQHVIKTIRNPLAPCNLPDPPSIADTSVCSGNAITLSASGIGELRWYNAPSGGNMLGTGSSFNTGALISDAIYYVEGYFCDASTSRVPLNISIKAVPVATISGNATGMDYVTLTASGGVSYEWSGGHSPYSATNTFTRSSAYNVTVTSLSGCSDIASIAVVVNNFGISRNGQLTVDTLTELSKNGEAHALTYVNKHGKIASSIPGDGLLNYAVFTTASACAANAADFVSLTNPANQTTSGTGSAATILNWSSWNALTSAGIPIPNSGEYFALSGTAYFVPEETGTYTFTCEGDDAVDLFINGVNVANNYGCHGIGGLGSHIGTISLVQGNRYTFMARMQENNGGEGLRVFWRRPSENSGWNIYTSEITSH